MLSLSEEAHWREYQFTSYWDFIVCRWLPLPAKPITLNASHTHSLRDLAACLHRRSIFIPVGLNGTATTWGFLCACVISVVMSQQIHISSGLKLIERKRESFLSLLVIPLLLLIFLYSPVSVFSPPETCRGSQSTSLQRPTCHFPTGLIRGLKQCSVYGATLHY